MNSFPAYSNIPSGVNWITSNIKSPKHNSPSESYHTLQVRDEALMFRICCWFIDLFKCFLRMLNINPWCCEDLAATSNHFILFNLSNVMFKCHVQYYMTSSFIWLDMMPNYDTKNFTLFNQQLKTIYNQNTLPKLLKVYWYRIVCKCL